MPYIFIFFACNLSRLAFAVRFTTDWPIEMQRSLGSGLVRMGQISKYLVGCIMQLIFFNRINGIMSAMTGRVERMDC